MLRDSRYDLTDIAQILKEAKLEYESYIDGVSYDIFIMVPSSKPNRGVIFRFDAKGELELLEPYDESSAGIPRNGVNVREAVYGEFVITDDGSADA